jgi:hypothetical protein
MLCPMSTIGVCATLRYGDVLISPSKDLPKWWMFKQLSFPLIQSELYPKLWIRTFLNAGSLGSHSCGQYSEIEFVLLHDFLEPPPRPCTKTRSTRGSDDECKRLSPRGPLESSVPSSVTVIVEVKVLELDTNELYGGGGLRPLR